MSGISFDREKTAGRLRALEEYAKQVRITPSDFQCRWLQSCNSSLGAGLQLKPEHCGGLAHVGEDYDVLVDGQELRILFVGKDYGWGRSELRERQAEIQTYSGEPNPHYKGIIKVLMESFQERCEPDSWRYLLRRMAQTNATRCSAPKENQKGKHLMESNITHTMRKNCWNHFRKEIEVLEPTLIWFHDADARDFVCQALHEEGLSTKLLFDPHQECQLADWLILPRPLKSVLAFFHHPAFGRFGRQWALATDVIARLREQRYLPTFTNGWKPLDKGEWPAI